MWNFSTTYQEPTEMNPNPDNRVAGFFHSITQNIANFTTKVLASLPVCLSITLGIVAVWLVGFSNVLVLVIVNLTFVGLPVVLLVRWMMKRRDQGKLY